MQPNNTGGIEQAILAVAQAINPIGFTVVQIQSKNFNSVASTTNRIPKDDTIPQNTEGAEFMTIDIVPKDKNNYLLVLAKVFMTNSVLNDNTVALFRDNGANALAADARTMNADYLGAMNMQHVDLAGSTDKTTFRVRAGGDLAGTTTFNGQASTRRYGGITLSNITVVEYRLN